MILTGFVAPKPWKQGQWCYSPGIIAVLNSRDVFHDISNLVVKTISYLLYNDCLGKTDLANGYH